MITIGICEDETLFVSELDKLIHKYSSTKGIDLRALAFPDGEQLLASRQIPDVILMDIKLPGQDGMEVVRRLRAWGCSSQVIFITAYQQYVFQAFDLDAVHYLLKPVTAEKLLPILDKAVKRAAAQAEKTILLTNGTVSARIPTGDILYCEALDHQITVHTTTGCFQFFGTLDAMQEKLADSRFFRCHRSYLVNMYRIIGRKQGTAIVAGGDEVLVARRKQREFAQRLLDTCREELV